LILDTKRLKLFEFSKLSSLAISELKLVKKGLQYTKYRYICGNKVKIYNYYKIVYN
jgi:hypothetical protein